MQMRQGNVFEASNKYEEYELQERTVGTYLWQIALYTIFGFDAATIYLPQAASTAAIH